MLTDQKCVPCEGGVPAMTKEEAQEHMPQVPGWELLDGKPLRIQRTFSFKDFKEAMQFTNKVADLAESEGHHPDIAIHWNKVTLTLYTHAINGLFLNDFIVAAKVNEL